MKRTIKIKVSKYHQLQKQLRQSNHLANEYKALYYKACKEHSKALSQLVDVLGEQVKKHETIPR